GHTAAMSHIERLLIPLPQRTTLITVIDGHPATLAWLGGVAGHRTIALGVEHFGQTGTIDDLYAHYGIDTDSIVSAAANMVEGRPMRHLRAIE
ncbi:MAG: transketolase, partial [Geminicoccaceae bacterium]|nr:transketolase [Geminicoccaceae bacterium]